MSQQQPSLIEQLEALGAFEGTERIGHRYRMLALEQRRLADLDVTPIGVLHRQAAALYDAAAASEERGVDEIGLVAPTGSLDRDDDDAA